MPRLCAVSVDLDEIPNYFAIHGLPEPNGRTARAVYEVALDRLQSFASAQEIPLTLFVVGSDAANPKNAAVLQRMSAHCHEIANHSLDHHYALTELPPDEMHRQVAASADVIEASVGVRPTGFRAPGYVMTDQLVDVLRSCDVAYDSSVFPCPAYYGAKAAAMGLIAVLGRKSRSIVDHPRVLTAPRLPYLLGRPYTRPGQGPLEMPVHVTKGARLPFIGTTLNLVGPTRARWLTRMVIGDPLVNLELHGIDVLAANDGLEGLVSYQPDVKIPMQRKLDTLSEVVRLLREEGYAFVRLDEAAQAFGGKRRSVSIPVF